MHYDENIRYTALIILSCCSPKFLLMPTEIKPCDGLCVVDDLPSCIYVPPDLHTEKIPGYLIDLWGLRRVNLHLA